MELSAETVADIKVVKLPGEYLDASTVKDFKANIAEYIEGDSVKAVFDMSGLQFIDSSGLGAILSCLRKLNGAGGELKLCGMTKPVRALFELVRMHRIMDIYDTLDDATSAYKYGTERRFMSIPSPRSSQVNEAYSLAQQRYADFGIDTDAAIDAALAIPVSLHCWQTDDVAGLENAGKDISGAGIMATGNYPGKAGTGDEIRSDLTKVMELLPGVHRVNLHASYAETDGEDVDRDAQKPEHFAHWISWAKELGIGLDFNTTFFAHPKADDGYTLAHPDKGIRDFWIRHGIACRQIAEHIGRELGPCVLNHWIPDGCKDYPADRWTARRHLVASYDEMFDDRHGIDTSLCVDAVESKLFGLGSEEFVTGSAEFYSNYALSRDMVLCLDMGHFHPTETIHDKISAHLMFHKKLLIHTSRPVRWDSDHVVTFNDDVRNVFMEISRGDAWDRVIIALDFFDASINRVGAYVVGTRATRKAILYSLLDPTEILRTFENEGRNAQRLGLMEDFKTMPFGAVWDMLCERAQVPAASAWIPEMQSYESQVLPGRS